MTECHIRWLADGDAAALLEFYNNLDREAKKLFHPLGTETDFSKCQEIVLDALAGKRHDLVLTRGGKIVGWAFIADLDREYPVLGIGLAEERQGKGFGAKLMKGLIEQARLSGCKGIDLIVVRTNERARRLYDRFGFVKTASFEGSDGLPYYRMRLEFR